MTMPIDFTLVRHGESEGNRAKKLAEKGLGHEVPEGFYERHSVSFRLTDKGIAQAKATGKWIRENLAPPFDLHVCSGATRAMETAAHLGIIDAQWRIDPRIQERDWGDWDVLTDEMRSAATFALHRQRMEADSFNAAPPNGESILDTAVRLWQPMFGLHEGFTDKRVLWVCHGEVMWTMRFLLERMTQREWRELEESRDPKDRIHNGQVLQYTRRNPETGELSPHLSWFRSVLPEDMSKSTNDWKPIIRRTFSNEDLLAEAAIVQRMVNNEPSK